jgi:hypothetical protein
MNREDIIRMAREAGFTDHNGFCEVIVRHSNGSWIGVKDELERFAALVAAAEREACAMQAWALVLGLADQATADIVLKAIRARGQE